VSTTAAIEPSHERPRVLQPDEAAIAQAAALIASGSLVAFPTETVYGLGGDATNGAAVAAIFAAKGRPAFNPLIVHVPDLAAAETLGQFSDLARRLALAFWPGPLTLVVPRVTNCPISLLATAGLETLAIRVPDHVVARQLLSVCGRPLAAPSANPSGRLSPTQARDVADSLNATAVPLVLDGGPCRVGVESTVVAVMGAVATLLRPGGLARSAIEAVAGPLAEAGEDHGAPASPGRLASHYAPGLPLRLDATSVLPDEALLAFGPDVPGGAHLTLNLSPRGDMAEAAANLFAMLRALDASGARAIAAMPVPTHGLGEAINDRLSRAAVR
jgi:L-threonylcarbamoyladenylate synthase